MKKIFPISLVLGFALVASCHESSDIDADEYIEDVTVEVHSNVRTILVVTWNQVQAADEVFLRFTFENDEWMESYPMPAEEGEHSEVVLGVPGETEVTIHLVVKEGDTEGESSPYLGLTEKVPNSMPRPTIESYDPEIASPHRWLYGTVDNTTGPEENYSGPFWLYIIDRQGRVVWYHSNFGDNPIMGFPRVARDGRYIFWPNRTPWDNNDGFVPSVEKMTLDHSFYEEIPLDLYDNVDMTDDGSILYNTRGGQGSDSWLREYTASGSDRPIWNCTDNFGNGCYSNTVNWNPLDDTVFMSFPYLNTVVEIDRVSGQRIATYGDASGSYSFSPGSWELEFNHYAHMTPHGTFMVSSHMPNSNSQHAFLEFEVDRGSETLTEKWVYNVGSEWAHAMGEAHYVEGSTNVLGNYGTAGVIREITQDKETAWYVKWDAPWSDDSYNKMVGHCILINDLYAINRGPE